MKTSPFAVALLAAGFLAAPSATQSAFDLIADQTPIRNQGSRNTCVTFAAVAALEAAYKRVGWTSIDLSEEFENYLGKTFWLHQTWNDIGSADETENQVGAFGGGGGTGHVKWLANGMRVPEEQRMRYRPGGYDLGAHPSWQDPHWQVQRNVNTFNLDPRNLPRAALTAPRYFYATGYATLRVPSSATEIESVLRSRREVVWDFSLRGDRSGSIWHADPNRPSQGAHSMLLVGYDRTHPDPRQHYFLAKNSWGPTSNPGGFTRIGYDYVQYGYEAGYFTGVATPGPWPQVAFVGRRNLCFDGHRGTLDVTHLPGIAQLWLTERGVNVPDRRIGTFFDANGTAHRVNGRIQGDKLLFWFKGSYPNMRWDDERESNTGVGRGFTYYIVDQDGAELAGWHQDNPGALPNPAFGGYAREPSSILGSDGFLQPSFSGSTPNDVLQYLGEWQVQLDGVTARMVFEDRDDSVVPAAQRGTWAGLRCRITDNGSTRTVVAKSLLANPRILDLSFVLADGRAVTTDCWMLSWQRGVFAGAATVGGGTEGIYGVRLANVVSGRFNTFGSTCGGRAGPLSHWAAGTPSIGRPVNYELSTAPGNAQCVLNFGIDSQRTSTGVPLPMNLTSLGAPGCWYHTESLVSILARTTGSGRASVLFRFGDPSMVGAYLYTQFYVLDPTANALGATFSNGVRTRIGS